MEKVTKIGSSNIGKTGVESIRIGGMTFDELPIAEGALTKLQIPTILANERENKIVNIKAKYPKQTVDWITGATNECNDSIRRIRMLVGQQRTMVEEYTALLSLCKHRDEALLKLDADADEATIKELKKEFPPYNVKAMHQQIKQCNEAIDRSDVVIDQEHASLSELRELRVKCVKRDAELKAVGE